MTAAGVHCFKLYMQDVNCEIILIFHIDKLQFKLIDLITELYYLNFELFNMIDLNYVKNYVLYNLVKVGHPASTADSTSNVQEAVLTF